ncbi:endonuclease domain-containing 1 protein [Eublepharis macularius]|uniref:Endonuclease domain-containing 1 protein n=1 Tax=Eublepharis macularius TaxID=481883 RepID=A0AA97J0R0_EUBMA|nr:endonuclease domain-containing 1 protein [Eublepharis macularius]
MRLAFALCLLALAMPGLGRARVVRPEEAGFAECDSFFLAQAPPEGLPGPPAHVKVCQTYKGEPRFATLYSTRDKIPLYSAFKYTEAAASGEESWLVEPQIDDPKNGLEDMVQEAEITGSLENLGENQALSADYVDSGYERTHLNPISLHKGDHQVATNTLTNAVPVPSAVQETWDWEVSNLVSRGLAPHCEKGKDLYLISGAVPSSVKVKDKVSVPESLWLAACCDNGSKSWSLAFLKPVAAGSRLEDLSLEALEKKLPSGVNLFKNHCSKDRNDPKVLEAVQHSVKEIAAEEAQAKKTPSTQVTKETDEDSGFLKKLCGFFITPIIKLLQYICSFIWQLVKLIVSLLCKAVHSLLQAVWTFLKGICSVLLSIFVNLVQAIVCILNGIATNIYNVLMLLYRIVSIPLNLILDIVSFPFYTLGAVPVVLQDIASGLGGMFLLIIDAITGFFKGLSYIASTLAGKCLPNMSSEL